MNETERIILDGPYLFSVEGVAVSSYRCWFSKQNPEGCKGVSLKMIKMLDRAYEEGKNDRDTNL